MLRMSRRHAQKTCAEDMRSGGLTHVRKTCAEGFDACAEEK